MANCPSPAGDEDLCPVAKRQKVAGYADPLALRHSLMLTHR